MSNLRQTNTRTDFPRGGAVDGEAFDSDEVHGGATRAALEERVSEDSGQGPKTRRRQSEILRGGGA